MKTKLLLTLMFLLPVITLSLFSQPMASMRVPYRQVIISEYNAGGATNSYIEFTNVGDSTVNMRDFYYYSIVNSINIQSDRILTVVRDGANNIVNVYCSPLMEGRMWYGPLPAHLLKPGECYIISAVFDRTNTDGSLIQREQLVEKSNLLLHPIENPGDSTIRWYNYPEYKNYAFDSVSAKGISTTLFNSSCVSLASSNRTYLQQRIYNAQGVVTDSVLIDGVNIHFLPNGTGNSISPNIAGKVSAMNTDILVRKSNIKFGSLNIDLQFGVSTEDSEWLLVPRFTGRDIYSTVGTHGNFTISATSGTLGIDKTQKKLTVPWGVYKGDSVIHKMTIGSGMAWTFQQNRSDFEGMGHTICQSNDTLTLYATGNVLDVLELVVVQQAPEANETRVFERRVLGTKNVLTGITPWVTTPPYKIRRFTGVIDSINLIPYSTRVDTLFKYLEKAEKATWNIIWSDGKVRADVKNGDILRVTAENGVDTHDYYLNVLPFAPSHNALLASITWPDKPGYLSKWTQDTIPFFDSRIPSFFIPVPYQTEGVPALQVTTQNRNATVQMFPAVSLDGTPAERTTRIKVTAEDDSVVFNYSITFQREKPKELVQDWKAEPIFSEMGYRTPSAANGAVEIYNPGTVPIDLTNYLITGGTNLLADIIKSGPTMTTASHWDGRYTRGYIPGYKWPSTLDEYKLKPGIVVFDPVVDPILEPAETFLMFEAGGEGPYHIVYKRTDVIFMSPSIDKVLWAAAGGNKWGESSVARILFNPIRANYSWYICKVLNDSIQQGLKPIKDPLDFEIIDLWGKVPSTPLFIAGKALDANMNVTIRRKPNIYLPNTIDKGGWGTNAEDSDWIVVRGGDTYQGVVYTSEMNITDYDHHYADEVTFFQSVVYSNVYKVDAGWKGNIYIRGVSHGETVAAFLNNLIKTDPEQTLVLSATAGGTAKASTEVVTATDILTVTSKDGKNKTNYKISLTALSDNNTLTLASGASYTIEREGNTGTVSGFPFGTTISMVYEKVKKPSTASMLIINGKDEILPMTVMNMDTVKVPVIADYQVFFKVTAENGDVAKYHLMPSSAASDAFVLSDLYIVNQDSSTISVVPGTTAVAAFFANLKPAAGATLRIFDKEGIERILGTVSYDDYLLVTSEDKTAVKAYLIQFIGEPKGLNAEERKLCPDPTNLKLTLVSATGTELKLDWDYDFGLEYGFVVIRDGAVKDTVTTNSFNDQGLTKGGTYNYSVYAYNEFGNSDSVDITVVAFPTAVDQIDAGSISIYPNITTDMVYFRNLPESSRVVLIDMTGRSIMIKKASDLRGGLSLQGYAKGYYLIKVMHGQDYVKSVKVLKQ